MRGIEPDRAFRAADQDGEGAEADGGLPGIASFGRQRSGRQSRAVPADPGGRLAGGSACWQGVRKRALVRARERTDRQDAALILPPLVPAQAEPWCRAFERSTSAFSARGCLPIAPEAVPL